MLYGEGQAKAFLRLQEEIIKRSDDHTIFAWPIHRQGQPGLLADSPEAFKDCQRVLTKTSRGGRSPYSLTNRGLSMELIVAQFVVDTYVALLECDDEGVSPVDGYAEELRLGIFLRRLNEDDQYARVEYKGKTFMRFNASTWDQEAMAPLQAERPVERIKINVRQTITESNIDDYKDRVHGFRIATPELLKKSKSGEDRFKCSAARWDPQQRILMMRPRASKVIGFGTVCFLSIKGQDYKIKVVKFGFEFGYNPVCFIATDGGLNRKEHALNRHGATTYVLDTQEAPWEKEEKAQFPGIYERTPFDKLGWSEVYDGIVFDLKQHTGLWALKGDHINGCNVQLKM